MQNAKIIWQKIKKNLNIFQLGSLNVEVEQRQDYFLLET